MFASMLQSLWHALTKSKHVWISCVASETTVNRFAVTCQHIWVMTKETVMALCSNGSHSFCSIEKKGCQDFLTSKYGHFSESCCSEVSHTQDGISEMDSVLTSLCRLAGQLLLTIH